MKKLTIKEVENEIDRLEGLLSEPQSMDNWSKLIWKYNALNIKYCQMSGEQPIVMHYKPEHIT